MSYAQFDIESVQETSPDLRDIELESSSGVPHGVTMICPDPSQHSLTDHIKAKADRPDIKVHGGLQTNRRCGLATFGSFLCVLALLFVTA